VRQVGHPIIKVVAGAGIVAAHGRECEKSDPREVRSKKRCRALSPLRLQPPGRASPLGTSSRYRLASLGRVASICRPHDQVRAFPAGMHSLLPAFCPCLFKNILFSRLRGVDATTSPPVWK
jgi:hypothetical protein